jgi:hypothetical protein
VRVVSEERVGAEEVTRQTLAVLEALRSAP